MLVDLLFIAAAVVVLIAIYKLKFSQESIKRNIRQATQQEEQNGHLEEKGGR